MATNLKDALEKLSKDKSDQAIKILVEYEKLKQKCEDELQDKKVAEMHVIQYGKDVKYQAQQVNENNRLIDSLQQENQTLLKEKETTPENETEEQKLERLKKIDDKIEINIVEIEKRQNENPKIEAKKQLFLQKETNEKKLVDELNNNPKLKELEVKKNQSKVALESLGLNINLDNYDTDLIYQKLSIDAQPKPEKEKPIHGYESTGTQSDKWKTLHKLNDYKVPLEKELKSLDLSVNPKKQNDDKWETKDKEGNILVVQPNSVSTLSDDPAIFPKIVETLIATQRAKAAAENRPFDIAQFNAKASGPHASEIDTLFQKRKAELIAQSKKTDSLTIVDPTPENKSTPPKPPPLPPKTGQKRDGEEPEANARIEDSGRGRSKSF